jgi:hypothetical protein
LHVQPKDDKGLLLTSSLTAKSGMAYTLGQAAKASGKSKPTILQAIRTNRLSATKDAFDRWQIDPAELYRVYPQQLTPQNDGEHQTNHDQASENRLLRATIEGLQQLCRQIESERDDLRGRLDQSEQERREKDRQLTALLTDQRTKPASEAIPMPLPAATTAPVSPGHVSPAPASTAAPAAENQPQQYPPRLVAKKASPAPKRAPKAEIAWWKKMIGSR